MNCGSCGRLLYANQKKCPCGWSAPERRAVPSVARPGDPQDSGAATKRKFAERQRKIDAHVMQYMAANRGATQREACLSYMKQIGCYTMFAKAFPHLVKDPEAQAEREAIQQESA